jgi:hypothetical protein
VNAAVLGPDSVLAPRHAARWPSVEVDDQVIVWNDATQELHHLDVTATLVLRLCDGESTLSQTAADLAHLFGVDPDQIRGDVIRCAGMLAGAGLVEPVAARAT